MKPALALAVLLLATPAAAGTLTLTIQTPQGTVTKTYTDTDANFTRLANAFQVRCTAAHGGVACTNAQLATFYFDWWLQQTIMYVKNTEQAANAAGANSGYTPINPQ